MSAHISAQNDFPRDSVSYFASVVAQMWTARMITLEYRNTRVSNVVEYLSSVTNLCLNSTNRGTNVNAKKLPHLCCVIIRINCCQLQIDPKFKGSPRGTHLSAFFLLRILSSCSFLSPAQMSLKSQFTISNVQGWCSNTCWSNSFKFKDLCRLQSTACTANAGHHSRAHAQRKILWAECFGYSCWSCTGWACKEAWWQPASLQWGLGKNELQKSSESTP